MEAKFYILERNQKEALQAIKSLAGKENIKDSSGAHFSWVDTESFVKARHIEDAFKAWRWFVEFDTCDNIINISFEGEKYGDDLIFFKVIAPYVEAGSYIQMQGEDGEMWRWVFDGKTVKEVKPKIAW